MNQTATAYPSSDAIAALAVEALEDVKGKEIVNLDTRELTSLFNRLVVCTGDSNRQVKALAQAHMQQLQRKIDELQSMRQTLEKLVQCCQVDERPDCPILQDLAGS